jgi:hypothetical protein
MATTTTVEYTIITKADVQGRDSIGHWSTQDGYQQQSSFNNGGTEDNLVVKRLDLLLKPTFYRNPLLERVADIDLSSLDVDYIRILHIKSNKQFLFSFSDNFAELPLVSPELQRVVFKDYGKKPGIGFEPTVAYPKIIRLMNPLEVNGGGSGNDITDKPIIVQVHLITSKTLSL